MMTGLCRSHVKHTPEFEPEREKEHIGFLRVCVCVCASNVCCSDQSIRHGCTQVTLLVFIVTNAATHPGLYSDKNAAQNEPGGLFGGTDQPCIFSFCYAKKRVLSR